MGAMRRGLTAAGFLERELGAINHYPAYLMFSPVLFRLGVWYSRLTALEPFRNLRASILCVFEKEPATATGRKPAPRSEPLDSIKIEVA